MNIPFRLYGLEGCPHCVQALQYLSKANVPVSVVEASGDPVVDAGIKTVSQQENAEFPVLVAFITNPKKIIVGFKEEKYKDVVETYNTLYRPSAPNAFVVERDNSNPPAQVVAESAPAVEGVA